MSSVINVVFIDKHTPLPDLLILSDLIIVKLFILTLALFIFGYVRVKMFSCVICC